MKKNTINFFIEYPDITKQAEQQALNKIYFFQLFLVFFRNCKKIV